VFKEMSTSERLGRRIIGSLALGAFAALANIALDISVSRRDGVHATNTLNEFLIGVGVALLGYAWVSRRDSKHALELSTVRVMREAIDKERKRIALEIHDSVGQALTGAILHLELASDFLPVNQPAREHVRRAFQLVCGSMTDMRCALWDLYPEELQKLGLKSAIECLVRDWTTSDGLKVHFSVNGLPRRLPLETEKALLRICQEALSNAVRHAQAREVRIQLFFDSQEARLHVKDDGRGFQPGQISESFGLISMQNRVQSSGGVWALHSEPGCGTDVQVSIPIPLATD
jgi:signal transduction histidine kinase